MVWALVWKHGGLILSPDTILASRLASYYNFIVLNSTSNGGSLALTQFTDRHHNLPGNYETRLKMLFSFLCCRHCVSDYIAAKNSE